MRLILTQYNVKYYWLIVSIYSINCRAQTSINYANEFNDCWDQQTISVLNEACEVFEKKLLSTYKNLLISEAYKQLLQDISASKIPPLFFLSAESQEIIDKFKQSHTFEKIWIRLSVVGPIYDDTEIASIPVPGQEQEEKKIEYDPFCINPNGDYLNCVMKASESKALTAYLKSLKDIPGISPGLYAGVLSSSLRNSDFDKGSVRLILAIGFYYDLALLFNKK